MSQRDDIIGQLADLVGVADAYRDLRGEVVRTSLGSKLAILEGRAGDRNRGPGSGGAGSHPSHEEWACSFADLRRSRTPGERSAAARRGSGGGLAPSG